MRISQIHFHADELKEKGFDCGINAEIQMPKLGQIVVLAGPNGSGKSRFLEALVVMDQRRGNASSGQLAEQKRECEERIRDCQRRADSVVEAEGKVGILNELKNWCGRLNDINGELRRKEMLRYEPEGDGPANHLRFVPSQAILEDAETMSPYQVGMNTNVLKNLGVGNSHTTTSSYIKSTLELEFNSTHPAMLGRVSEEVIKTNLLAAKELKEIIKILLGEESDPHYTVGRAIALFGRSDYHNTLSSGQKLLLQMAAILHAQNTKLKEVILLLDEPENHLHPSAIIEVVSRLKTACADGQIWIATHCVPLIAHLVHDDPNCLWYVHDGQVSWAGRKPELVLNSLMGGQDGANRLHQFTLLPAQFATTRFLSECLLPPGTVGADTTDPQTNQIAGIIHKLHSKNEKNKSVRLLDYGAGQGRLLSTISSTSEVNVCDWLDYYAYDAYDDDKERCIDELNVCYPGQDVQKRYFRDLSKINTKLDYGSFDLVVMCNVLHEIDPGDWINAFGPDSYIAKFLKDDGYLLVVEDYLIPVGETAHQYGFLLLDEAELKALFGVTEKDCNEARFVTLDAYEGVAGKEDRLKAHLISAALVRQITVESRLKTVKEIKATAEARIDAIRKTKSTSFIDGQRYALFTQIYANASIWLSRHSS